MDGEKLIEIWLIIKAKNVWILKSINYPCPWLKSFEIYSRTGGFAKVNLSKHKWHLEMRIIKTVQSGPSSGYSLDVDHGQGVSYQRVSGFDDQGNQFGYEHDFRHWHDGAKRTTAWPVLSQLIICVI